MQNWEAVSTTNKLHDLRMHEIPVTLRPVCASTRPTVKRWIPVLCMSVYLSKVFQCACLCVKGLKSSEETRFIHFRNPFTFPPLQKPKTGRLFDFCDYKKPMRPTPPRPPAISQTRAPRCHYDQPPVYRLYNSL